MTFVISRDRRANLEDADIVDLLTRAGWHCI